MNTALASISLTHVQYDPTLEPRLFTQFLAYCSLVPIFLIVSYVTLFTFRRDVATLLMFLGQLLNEGFNYILKTSIKEPRPTGSSYQKS